MVGGPSPSAADTLANLIVKLPPDTWVLLAIWAAVCLMYFDYSVRK